MPEFVRLVNRRDIPFDFMASNRKRIIAPGGDAIVPWGLATSLFGDPRIHNTTARNERNALYNKVRGRFNYALGMMTDEEWAEIAPDIDVYDLETDLQVFLIYQDPEGTRADELEGQVPNDQTDLAILQHQIAALTMRLNQYVSAATAEPSPASSSTQALVTPSTDTAIMDDVSGDDAVTGDATTSVGDSGVEGGSVSPVIDPPSPSVDTPQQVPVGQSEPTPPPAKPARTPAKK